MRVLVATGRPPWPPWRGDQLRARQLVEALAEAHEVTWLAPSAAGEPGPPAGVRRETFRTRPAAIAALLAAPGALRGWPLQALPFRQPQLGKRLRELAPRHDLVVLQLARLLPHLNDAAGTDDAIAADDATAVRDAAGPPLVVDLIDCLSLNAATRARFDRVFWRPLLRAEARRLAAAERRLVEASRTALVVGERDRRALVEGAGARADRLAVAPIAMAAPSTPATPVAPPGGATVMLTGNLGYFPNRDAARFLLGDVWPRLAPVEPAARLVVAGNRPPPGLARRVEAAGARLIPRPPDLRAVLAGATVAVAPLRCGSGVPLKVLDAWAAGVPVVASPFAAEGAGAEAERDLLVADTPAAWVDQLRRLLGDPVLRRRLAEAGRDRLSELTPERVYPLLRRLIAGR